MAYFLDPELAALTAANNSRIPQQRTSKTAVDSGRRKNKFGKTCHKCRTWVRAEAGYLDRVDGVWVVYCSTCP